MAMNSISGRDDAAARVVHLRDVLPAFARRGLRCRSKRSSASFGIGEALPPVAPSVGPSSASVSPRSSIQRARSGGRPERMSIFAVGSVYGPEVS